MTNRDIIQKEASISILREKDLILFISLRLGKTRIALQAIEDNESVLVCFPNTAILSSWRDEIVKFTPKSTNITFTTNASLKKFKNKHFDYIIIDEPQLLSPLQINHLKTITYNKRVGLSGTLNDKTIKRLNDELGLQIKFTYGISQAILDGLVKDYEINLLFTEMDNTVRNIPYKKYGKEVLGTEKEVYNSYTQTMEYFNTRFQEEGQLKDSLGYKKYMGNRTNFLYNSKTLFELAKKTVNNFKDEKCLIYTLRTEIADELSDISFHSKNKSDEVLALFKESTEGHLSVVNCVQAGVTIKHLNKVIFHSYESNEEKLYQKLGRSLFYEFKGQKAQIYICVLKDTQMETWVNRAIKSLEQEKVKYIFKGIEYNKIEWIKFNNPGKKLYLYNDSICYFVGGLSGNEYVFIDNPYKSYNLNQEKLEEIL